jgi:hypothetical protein
MHRERSLSFDLQSLSWTDGPGQAWRCSVRCYCTSQLAAEGTLPCAAVARSPHSRARHLLRRWSGSRARACQLPKTRGPAAALSRSSPGPADVKASAFVPVQMDEELPASCDRAFSVSGCALASPWRHRERAASALPPTRRAQLDGRTAAPRRRRLTFQCGWSLLARPHVTRPPADRRTTARWACPALA